MSRLQMTTENTNLASIIDEINENSNISLIIQQIKASQQKVLKAFEDYNSLVNKSLEIIKQKEMLNIGATPTNQLINGERLFEKTIFQQVKIVKLEYKLNGIKTKIFWQEIIEIVEQDVGIPAFDFMSVRREKRLADPRLLVYALTADCCPYLSLPAIGRLAHRDHTTILKGRIRGRQHPSYQKLKAALLSRLSLPSVDV